jgi:hypothetical protein
MAQNVNFVPTTIKGIHQWELTNFSSLANAGQTMRGPKFSPSLNVSLQVELEFANANKFSLFFKNCSKDTISIVEYIIMVHGTIHRVQTSPFLINPGQRSDPVPLTRQNIIYYLFQKSSQPPNVGGLQTSDLVIKKYFDFKRLF